MNYYMKRLAEEEARLNHLIKRSQSADGEEWEQITKEVIAAQKEVNNWREAVERLPQ